MTDPDSLWPLLIVNARVLVAPDFLVDRAASDPSVNGILRQEINPGIPPVTDTILVRTFQVSNVGSLTAYFRFTAITGDLVNQPSIDVLYDEGLRRRRMIEGFITRAPVPGDINSLLFDNLRPKIRDVLERYIKDTSEWPAAEGSHAIAISDLVAAEPEVLVPAQTEPAAVVAVEKEPYLDIQDDRRLTPEPAASEPNQLQTPERRSIMWRPTSIVAMLIIIAVIAGVIVYVVITRLLL